MPADRTRTRLWFGCWLLAVVVSELWAWWIACRLFPGDVGSPELLWGLVFGAFAIPALLPLLIWTLLGEERKKVGSMQILVRPRPDPIGIYSIFDVRSPDAAIRLGLYFPLAVTLVAVLSDSRHRQPPYLAACATMFLLNALFEGLTIRSMMQTSKARGPG